MRITESMNELPRFEIADLCQHQGKQRIGGNIKRHAEENIRTALIELAGQFALRDIELEKRMTGCQRHFIVGNVGLRTDALIRQVRDIPGRNNDAAAVGVGL